MSITTKTLLLDVTSNVTGETFKANAYYDRTSHYSTLDVSLDQFDENIKIECSNTTNPTEYDWIDITPIFPESDPEIPESQESFVIKGNFAWVRARVTDYVSGTVNLITLVY